MKRRPRSRSPIAAVFALALALLLVACASNGPPGDVLGDIDALGPVEVMDVSCSEGRDYCSRGFLFTDADYDEVNDAIDQAGFGPTPGRCTSESGRGYDRRCAHVFPIDDGYVVTVTDHYVP